MCIRDRRLGLLGGMSWESSIEYERTINELVRERVGGIASADLIIRSFNFADIEALQVDGKWDEAGQVLSLIHISDSASLSRSSRRVADP